MSGHFSTLCLKGLTKHYKTLHQTQILFVNVGTKSARLLKTMSWNHLVGSSRKMIGGLFTNSSAIAKRFLWPPDISFIYVWAVAVKPNTDRISSIYKNKGDKLVHGKKSFFLNEIQQPTA